MSELKPCPFCGGNNCGVRAGTDEIWCVCGGHSPHGWNSRPIENKLQAEIKRLQTRVQELEQERAGILTVLDEVVGEAQLQDPFSDASSLVILHGAKILLEKMQPQLPKKEKHG